MAGTENHMDNHRNRFSTIRRLVVKVGTSTVAHENGTINLRRIDRLAMVLSDIMNRGIDVILVTSGAVGVGVGVMKLDHRPETIGGKQAAAAVGQCVLMNIYSKMLNEYGKSIAQMLLTKDILEDDNRKLNVINTFENLLIHGVLPIVNENDSVATDELEYGEKKLFGDNDMLSAIVSLVVKADLLVLLTDVDGFYAGDPRKYKDVERIHQLFQINEGVMNYAGEKGSVAAKGGMITKLEAAKVVMEKGIDMVLANGMDPSVIFRILDGDDVGTVFVGRGKEKQV